MINIKDEKYLKAFGANMKKVRRSKKLSQEALAYKADISLSQVGRIERGETNPTISTIKHIALYLEVEVSMLFDFEYD